MEGIISVINKCYELLQTRLSFGSFSFSLLSVWITFGGLILAGLFFGRLFDAK